MATSRSLRRGRSIQRLTSMLALAVLAVVAGLSGLRPAGAGGVPSRLGGLWQLDPKESETLREKMQEMGRGGGGPGFRGGDRWPGGMGGGPMGGMRRRGAGFRGPRPEGDERGGGRDSTRGGEMRMLARPPLSLLIEPGDSTLTLSERGRTIQVLVVGDMSIAKAAIQPDAPHVQASWKGKRLVAERTSARGGHMTEEFELDDPGDKLTIRTRIEGRGDRPPLELKRVYRRSEGDANAPPPIAAPPDSIGR